MRWLVLSALILPSAIRAQQPTAPALPDAPSATTTYRQTISVTTPPPPCQAGEQPIADPEPPPALTGRLSCTPAALTPPQNKSPYQRFLNSLDPLPLSARQKSILAVRDVVDPANLFTVAANAGFTIGIDPHTGYGPGWKGFGRDVGYSLVQDATGEFISTFAIDTIAHEDPHYHRSPQASVPRRFMHAISHTVISQHDDGRPMINYGTLLTYPISAEIANLYVPGVHGNASSTVTRVLTGIASNPIDDLITEFLPDFAKRFHVRIVFVQQILNNIATERPGQ